MNVINWQIDVHFSIQGLKRNNTCDNIWIQILIIEGEKYG